MAKPLLDNEPMTGRQISDAMARKKTKNTAQKRAADLKKSTKSKKTIRKSNR
jgi:hypothetical protein